MDTLLSDLTLGDALAVLLGWAIGYLLAAVIIAWLADR